MGFIKETVSLHTGKKELVEVHPLRSSTSPFGVDFSTIPMRFANALELPVSQDGQVHFLNASKEVLKFTCSGVDMSVLSDLEACEEKMNQKEAEKLRRLEERKTSSSNQNSTVREQVAAMKLQKLAKNRSDSGLRIGKTDPTCLQCVGLHIVVGDHRTMSASSMSN